MGLGSFLAVVRLDINCLLDGPSPFLSLHSSRLSTVQSDDTKCDDGLSNQIFLLVTFLRQEVFHVIPRSFAQSFGWRWPRRSTNFLDKPWLEHVENWYEEANNHWSSSFTFVRCSHFFHGEWHLLFLLASSWTRQVQLMVLGIPYVSSLPLSSDRRIILSHCLYAGQILQGMTSRIILSDRDG